MRINVFFLAILVGFSACNSGSSGPTPGGSGPSNGSMTATFSNIVGTPPSGISTAAFTATSAYAGTAGGTTTISGVQGNRVIVVNLPADIATTGSCTQPDGFGGFQCMVSIGLEGQPSTIEFSEQTQFTATQSGNSLTIRGTGIFKEPDNSHSRNFALDATVVPQVTR
jgi:hypothetical protein